MLDSLEKKKRHFEKTLKLFEEIKFDMAYIACYSERPETKAALFKNDVLLKQKKERRKILTEILKKTALLKNRAFIGKTVEVLCFQKKQGFIIGKSKEYKTVKFKSKKNLIGKFVKVKITDAFFWGLKG